MTYVIAGAISGFFMASVFVAVGPIMLFILSKDPSPRFRALIGKVPPLAMTMALVVLAYPLWIMVGVVTALLYRLNATLPPIEGEGTPSAGFAIAVVVVAAILAAPLAILLRKVVVGVVALAFVFIGVFGWLLPFMAS